MANENETLMLDPADLYTCQGIVFDFTLQRIKRGVELGDELPSINVGEILHLGDEFDGKYAVSDGNHRAFTCLKLGMPVKAEFDPKFKPKSHYLQKVENLAVDYNDKLAAKCMKNKFYREAK